VRGRRWIEASLGIGVGGGLLYWVLRDYPWQTLREVSWHGEWIAGAALLMGLAHVLRAWRWRLFLRASGSAEVPFLEAFMALMAGYLVNLGLPRAGEVARCSLLYHTRKVPLATSLGTVIGERVLDVLLLGVWALIVVSREGANWLQQLGLWQWLPLLALGTLIGLGILWAFYRYRERLPWGWAQRIAGGMAAAFMVRPRYQNLLLSVGIWIGYWLATWMAGRAFGEGFSLWAAWVLLVGSGLAMALPVPGGLGTFHTIGFVLLSYLGYSEVPAKTLVLLIHAFQTLHTLLLGLIAVGYFAFRRTKAITDISPV